MNVANTAPAAVPLVLTIAGTDPSGGAGIQVDLQVMRDLGCHGLSVITALVCQNTRGVRSFETVSVSTLRAQLDAIAEDFDLQAIKIGMVPGLGSFEVLADFLEEVDRRVAVVLDPVLASGDGRSALHADGWFEGLERVRERIDLLTPNVPEAAQILGLDDPGSDAAALACELHRAGWARVLVKGGHLPPGAGEGVVDVLADATGERNFEPLSRVEDDVRGTGCQLASAIACYRARGLSWEDATIHARQYLNGLLHHNARRIGRGRPLVVRVRTEPE
ncbi:hydroxymethylpyrimidine/phosphomethylpyrimidine kinase [Lujinxingia vulgaris]|uniref:hydroxymethylpyrimidine kinase n=1 Tax=Lujinxingia vulgaris TaxID=2600176 RepID=A0A5C6XCV8_9DELT|nr:hydroxymethylpyrimidine/phosphomethylpyrimidine kinase [Lujinxingia vulgaris]TXD35941.1 hydroxymethylpyrimidine/phosphomethylpyrimidine kinase [Lujinxingia vulgaris]